jgi:hypothetical protein
MSKESAGEAGAVNKQSGASGLIQVIPGTLAWYNKATKSNVPLSAMRSADPAAAAIQLRVGLWVLGRFWRSAYRWLQKRTGAADIPLDELVRWGDAFYAAGPGRVQELTDRLSPVTWSNWSAKHPTSNITRHANYVWDKTREQGPTWNLTAVDQWVRKSADSGESTIMPPQGGLLLGLLVMLVGWYLLAGKKGTEK